MKTLILAVLVFPLGAAAECHLNNPNAIVCLTPDNALGAYRHFGDNAQLTNQPYNRDILRRYGCTRPYGAAYSTVHIEEVGHTQVPTSSGYGGVTTASINGSDIYYVADGYLSGTCAKYRPKTYSVPPPQ
nr:MAG TPA: hypothetical protein [Caudoviricetes sp.]